MHRHAKTNAFLTIFLCHHDRHLHTMKAVPKLTMRLPCFTQYIKKIATLRANVTQMQRDINTI